MPNMIRSVATVFNWKSFTKLEVKFWGLAAAAGMVVLGCSLIGFGARFGWLFELTSHFRLQYAIFLFVLGAAFALHKAILPASLFFAGTLINLVPIAPYLLPASPPRHADVPSLRLLLINVRSANADYAGVMSMVEAIEPAILLLEEINPRWLLHLDALRASHPFGIREPRDDDFGIALFSRIPLEHARIAYLGKAEVPSIEAEFTFAGRRVLLIGTHPVPPGNPVNFQLRNEQLLAVAECIAGWTGPAILLGDLNTTPYSPYFGRLLRTARLHDSARGFGPHGTWPEFPEPFRIPLDHCLISKDFVVLDRKIGPRLGSDHLPLMIHLSLPSR
jgi:endonuclease/exonuclease/phosphatase (EEP) superfamily protein YafD